MKRAKYSEEQIVRILQEAESGKKSQAEICRKHRVSLNTFYVWKRNTPGWSSGMFVTFESSKTRTPV